jgi:hypothetical protein
MLSTLVVVAPIVLVIVAHVVGTVAHLRVVDCVYLLDSL